MKRRNRSTGATGYLYRRFYEGKPDQVELLEEAIVGAEVARRVYDLREAAGLTQREPAHRVGTTASVICRLEGANYNRHSLTMLQRIATALNQRVEVRFVPLKKRKRRAAPSMSSRR